MVKKVLDKGVVRDMTAEETAFTDAEFAKEVEEQNAENARVAQLATDKANAKAKLIAGEALTEAEADTIVL